MKLVVNFDRPRSGSPIPYDHQYMVYSGLLKCLSSVDSSLSDALHSTKKKPNFVMSQLLGVGGKVFDKDGIQSQRYVLLIASRDLQLLEQMRNGIEGTKEMRVGVLDLPYHSSEIVKVSVPGPFPELVTKSPIALKKDGRFIRHGEDSFEAALKDNVRRKYASITGCEAPDTGVLRIMESKTKLFRVGPAMIPCTHMRFCIDAPPELIAIMLTDGIGSKNQLGFGFIEEARS
jgi:CRISPR-associated endoribonuclease Cas6